MQNRMMKSALYILAIFFVAALSNCHSGNKTANKSRDTLKQNQKVKIHPIVAKKDTLISDTFKTRKLLYGFILRVRDREGTGKFKPIHYMEIWHKDFKIFTDTSDTSTAYNFDEKPYPILNQLRPNVFELLIAIANNPSKDLVICLRIENNKIVKRQMIPTFDGGEIINGVITYHGIWDYGEVWDENGKTYATYNPRIYYKFTADGVKLDSALTILKNKKVYGRFEGFEYKSVIGYPSDHRGNITDTTAKKILRKP